MITYNDLVNEFRTNPREISTAPINGRAPKWFSVYELQYEVYVAPGRNHPNACRVSSDRRLKPSELPVMMEIYQRRKKGEPVSQEARDKSINQSYWFGIFKELSM